MSRCFPYPLPGYAKNGIRDEAPIESIKLQRQGEKAKKERKKEKRREKKEKEKVWEGGDVESKKHKHKKRHRDERNQQDQKGGYFQKGGGNESEQLDKSSLTEEHGHPVGSQNSSDSTLNSNKRQKQSSQPDGRHNNSGSIIRIRLPFQRHKDPEVPPSKEQPCLASGRTDDAFVERMHEPVATPCSDQGEPSCSSSRNSGQELALRHSKEKPSLSFGPGENFAPLYNLASLSHICGSNRSPSALKYKDLIEDWVPPQMQSQLTDLDDQGWLFGTKQRQKQKQKQKQNQDCFCLSPGYSTAWPHACHLPVVDIYALPFTVPL